MCVHMFMWTPLSSEKIYNTVLNISSANITRIRNLITEYSQGSCFNNILTNPGTTTTHTFICGNVLVLQSSAIVTLSNLSRYHRRYCDDSNRTQIKLQTHNSHPIAHGRAMGCVSWGFWRKLTVLKRNRSVFPVVENRNLFITYAIRCVRWEPLTVTL